jgi:hypothetical protein
MADADATVEDAEEAVLSAILLEPAAALDTCRGVGLGWDDFADGRRKLLYRACELLLGRGITPDVVTLPAFLAEKAQLEAAGGKDYLGRILDAVPTAANVQYHAALVLERAKRRELGPSLSRLAGRVADMSMADIAANLRTAVAAVERNGQGGLRHLTLLDDEEISNLATPAQLVDGVLPNNALAVLFGEKGAYKTFLALDIAIHVRLGLEWHGRRVRQGSVVYVYAEGQTGLRPRIEAWKRLHRVPKLGILFLPRRVTINEPADCAALLGAIEARQGRRDAALIVIDTLNRNMAGNENSTEDMSAFVRGCDTLREATGATALILHHSGHGADDRGRGSSVLEAAADTVIYCSRDADRITLECKKQKDAGEFGTLAMEVIPVSPSLILKPSGVEAGGLKGQRLQCLRALHDNYTADIGATYKAWMEVTAIGPSSFNKAREWLRANSYVVPRNGKWLLTDAGRLALHASNSTRSTATPLGESGVGSTLLHSSGGVYIHPEVELDLAVGSG